METQYWLPFVRALKALNRTLAALPAPVVVHEVVVAIVIIVVVVAEISLLLAVVVALVVIRIVEEVVVVVVVKVKGVIGKHLTHLHAPRALQFTDRP
ncbi:hypothetical protein ElyMa_006921200 [Elysia marginata]|uniref:Uncharacterized protein n=1 Tax=Elysia marginata TaxID=1093978 RepID=A0AAV4JF62_9GAST|nr:hypothetical protein ElyMa_006921200 [Elysia marginata]